MLINNKKCSKNYQYQYHFMKKIIYNYQKGVSIFLG